MNIDPALPTAMMKSTQEKDGNGSKKPRIPGYTDFQQNPDNDQRLFVDELDATTAHNSHKLVIRGRHGLDPRTPTKTPRLDSSALPRNPLPTPKNTNSSATRTWLDSSPPPGNHLSSEGTFTALSPADQFRHQSRVSPSWMPLPNPNDQALSSDSPIRASSQPRMSIMRVNQIANVPVSASFKYAKNGYEHAQHAYDLWWQQVCSTSHGKHFSCPMLTLNSCSRVPRFESRAHSLQIRSSKGLKKSFGLRRMCTRLISMKPRTCRISYVWWICSGIWRVKWRLRRALRRSMIC